MLCVVNNEQCECGVGAGVTPTKVVYYESIKRDLKTKPIYECRCDERLKSKSEASMYTSHVHWFDL